MSATTSQGQPWDTRKGRRWVVVAFWGAETSVEFCATEELAIEAYERADDQGADVFYAETKRLRKHRPVVRP